MGRPKLSILDETEILNLHNASLQILGSIGVRIPHAEMRMLFRAAGAQVAEDVQIVRIPETLLMECLEKAGRSYTLFGRDRTKQVTVGMGTRHYASSAGQASWVEDAGTVRRYATLNDIADAARLADVLPLMGLVGAMAAYAGSMPWVSKLPLAISVPGSRP